MKLLVGCRCTVLDATTWIIVESAEYMDVYVCSRRVQLGQQHFVSAGMDYCAPVSDNKLLRPKHLLLRAMERLGKIRIALGVRCTVRDRCQGILPKDSYGSRVLRRPRMKECNLPYLIASSPYLHV
jgi:hypothetical protein